MRNLTVMTTCTSMCHMSFVEHVCCIMNERRLKKFLLNMYIVEGGTVEEEEQCVDHNEFFLLSLVVDSRITEFVVNVKQ